MAVREAALLKLKSRAIRAAAVLAIVFSSSGCACKPICPSGQELGCFSKEPESCFCTISTGCKTNADCSAPGKSVTTRSVGMSSLHTAMPRAFWAMEHVLTRPARASSRINSAPRSLQQHAPNIRFAQTTHRRFLRPAHLARVSVRRMPRTFRNSLPLQVVMAQGRALRRSRRSAIKPLTNGFGRLVASRTMRRTFAVPPRRTPAILV